MAATVQVIALGHGGHPGVDGPYVSLEFATARTVVHLEQEISALFRPASTQRRTASVSDQRNRASEIISLRGSGAET